jgi:hypothetical protein
MTPFEAADLRKMIANDSEGRATRAILRWLRDASRPMSGSLHDSLSLEEQRLLPQLIHSIEKAERDIVAAWEELHPGRRFPRE